MANDNATNSKTYRLFASGDTMLSRRFPSQVYLNGPQWPLQQLSDLIQGADIAMTNLECVIATRGTFWNKQEHKPFYYRAPPVVLDVLTAAGFDVVTSANNHAMDFGPDALMEHLELLETAGIAAVGSGRNVTAATQPKYIRTGDMTLAIFGMTTYNAPIAAHENRPGVLWLDNNAKVLQVLGPAIVEARHHADLVVFSPHWGGNWTEGPSADRVELAHKLIDLGVDAIMGHSAHQLHGVEVYKGHPIVYDMGNFLWDLKEFKKRTQLTAGFVFEFNHTGFTRLVIHPLQMQFVHTVHAEGAVLTKIQAMMIRMSKALNPAVEFQHDGDALVLQLQPSHRGQENITPPGKIYVAGQTRSLPDQLRMKPSNVVYGAIPEWVNKHQSIRLTQGVEFLGARMVEAAHRDAGFTAEIVLKVSGPLNAWLAEIKGVERHGDDQFTWYYPVAYGNWPPESWRENDIGADLIFVRPPQLKGGTYDISWRLVNPVSGEVTSPVGAADGHADGFIPIGEIWMGSLGIPREAAGVSWSGVLDFFQTVLKTLNLTKPRIMLLARLSVLALILVLVYIMIKVWRRRTLV